MASQIEETYGVLYFAEIITTFLFGVGTLQVYFYFLHYPEDTIFKKLLVTAVWLLSLLHTILILYATYFFTILALSNPENLIQLSWASNSAILVSNVLIFIVQCFLARRVYAFLSAKKSALLPKALFGLMLVFITCNFVFDMIGTIQVLEFKTIQQVLASKTNKKFTIAALSFTVAVDSSIALILCWALLSSRTGFHKTDQTLHSIVIYTVNTGLLPSLFAITGLATLLTIPNTFWYILCLLALGNLYANTLLATLNTRSYFMTKLDRPTSAINIALGTTTRSLAFAGGPGYTTDNSGTGTQVPSDRGDLSTSKLGKKSGHSELSQV